MTDLRTRQASKMNGFYISRNKVFGQDVPLLATKMTAAGVGWNPSKARIFRPATGEGTMFVADLYTKYRKVASTEAGAAHVLACWEREFSDRLVHCLHGPQCRHGAQCLVGKRMVDIHVLSGSVVPVWGTIESAIGKIAHGATEKARARNLKIVSLRETSLEDEEANGDDAEAKGKGKGESRGGGRGEGRGEGKGREEAKQTRSVIGILLPPHAAQYGE